MPIVNYGLMYQAMVKAAKGKFNEIVYSDCRRPTILLGVTALRRVGDVSFLLIIPSANVLRISFYMTMRAKAIIDFVRNTTDRSSPKFVPPQERVAVFDQDATLWSSTQCTCS